MKLPLAVLSASLAAAMVVSAQVPEFAHPPISNNYSSWLGQAPYQRNIYLDFSIDPVGYPNTSGISGADYAGDFDSILHNIDHVTFSGGMRYFSAAESPNGIAGVGIWNRTSAFASGDVIFNLGTLSGAAENLWAEAVFQTGLGQSSFSYGVKEGGTISDAVLYSSHSIVDPSGDPWLGVRFFQTYGCTITPAPDVTELFFNAQNVSPNGYIIMNTLHIAAESVPEPSIFSLLIIGLFAIWYNRTKNVLNPICS